MTGARAAYNQRVPPPPTILAEPPPDADWRSLSRSDTDDPASYRSALTGLVPGSKSVSQRALLLAALARGTTTLVGLDSGDDTLAAREVAATLARVEEDRDQVTRVHGAGGEERSAADLVLDVGQSATLARLVTGAAALARLPGSHTLVRGRGTLARRTSAPLLEALAGSASIEPRGTVGWPLELVSGGESQALLLRKPVSSQEVSALLIGASYAEEPRTVRVAGSIPSRPYLDLTIALLETFGASVGEGAWESGPEFVVRGPLIAPARPLEIEPDASSAAVLQIALALVGAESRLEGLGAESAQPDRAAADFLTGLGCRVEESAHATHVTGAHASAPERLDLSGNPDLALPLAVAVADLVRRTESRRAVALIGLETLSGKESDRLVGLAELFAGGGWRVEVGPGSLTFGPGADPPPEQLWVDPRGDHRMAFAAALLGLVVPGVRCLDPECVSKSWPGFWEAAGSLGFRVESGRP